MNSILESALVVACPTLCSRYVRDLFLCALFFSSAEIVSSASSQSLLMDDLIVELLQNSIIADDVQTLKELIATHTIEGILAFKSESGQNILHLFAKHNAENCYGHCRGNIARVAVYLNAQDNELNTPLHIAITHSAQQLFLDFLEDGARLDLKNALGQNPVHAAVINNKGNLYVPDICERLSTQLGGDLRSCLNSKDASGKTPLDYAIIEEDDDSIKRLVQLDATGNFNFSTFQDILYRAVNERNLDLFEILIDKYGVEYVAELLKPGKVTGETFLHDLARCPEVAFIEDFIVVCDAEDHINDSNNRGQTPLDIAFECESIDILDFLIDLGAKHAATKSLSVDVLFEIIKEDNDKIFEYAIEAGLFDPYSIPSGRSILFELVENDAINCFMLLWDLFKKTDHIENLDKYRDPKTGENILHLVALNPFIDSHFLSLILEENNALVLVSDQEGNLPLHAAVIADNPFALEEMLTCKNINVAALNTQGKTPLQLGFEIFSLSENRAFRLLAADVRRVPAASVMSDYRRQVVKSGQLIPLERVMQNPSSFKTPYAAVLLDELVTGKVTEMVAESKSILIDYLTDMVLAELDACSLDKSSRDYLEYRQYLEKENRVALERNIEAPLKAATQTKSTRSGEESSSTQSTTPRKIGSEKAERSHESGFIAFIRKQIMQQPKANNAEMHVWLRLARSVIKKVSVQEGGSKIAGLRNVPKKIKEIFAQKKASGKSSSTVASSDTSYENSAQGQAIEKAEGLAFDAQLRFNMILKESSDGPRSMTKSFKSLAVLLKQLLEDGGAPGLQSLIIEEMRQKLSYSSLDVQVLQDLENFLKDQFKDLPAKKWGSLPNRYAKWPGQTDLQALIGCIFFPVQFDSIMMFSRELFEEPFLQKLLVRSARQNNFLALSYLNEVFEILNSQLRQNSVLEETFWNEELHDKMRKYISVVKTGDPATIPWFYSALLCLQCEEYAKAEFCYLNGSKRDDDLCSFHHALTLENKKERTQVRVKLQKKGDFGLGLAYMLDHYYEPDFSKRSKLCELASSRGVKEGAYFSGMIYAQNGKIVEACKAYLRAARHDRISQGFDKIVDLLIRDRTALPAYAEALSKPFGIKIEEFNLNALRKMLYAEQGKLGSIRGFAKQAKVLMEEHSTAQKLIRKLYKKSGVLGFRFRLQPDSYWEDYCEKLVILRDELLGEIRAT